MYHKSDIEILIATMNQTNFDFLETMFLFSDYSKFNILIVNQTTNDKLLHSDNERIKVLNVFEKGLSKSRNVALENATKKLLIFTDDDVVFEQKFYKKIIKAFNSNSKHNGFRFQYLNGQGKLAKKYPKTFQSKLTSFEILNTSSVELVFKRESLKDANLKFDENFGLGTKFFMGEEAIFVSDGIKKGLKIGFVPEELLSHSQPSTSHKTAISEVYFVQSAVFYRIFGKMYLFWIALKLFFDLKQSKIAFSKVGYLFKQAQKGKEAYVNATKL
jgi:glycosyltransferase involved in cell wall biosynthesis